MSSPAALQATLKQRINRLDPTLVTEAVEIEALRDLQHLNERSLAERGGKYGALVDYLKKIGIGRNKPERVVIFAERIATLDWLAARLTKEFKLPDDAVAILQGQLSDQEQQEVVESFKQESSPIRILITGDVASEGVNLHLQCHELVHYDIPGPSSAWNSATAASTGMASVTSRKSPPWCWSPPTTASPVTSRCSLAWSKKSMKPTPPWATSLA
ncbi:C-terminal helicase domain-containing protein [Ornithinimicrobium sp. INDO-MA30-4]|uniref:C-terminal helicase domain-containing protein n=1 Tax=Ornithinimicrobium sp. INDO-MA30-4 TaxID=2908651 RepID=UPI001F429DD1|nr:C-terminal helicase domain-containing protein [Ornithinimicrobium sp. INDO-MA30-4]UJH69568.1 SWF/SNF helicase family protein [Ornithinimicrobium sp. INDO-MA30-4]